MIIFIQDDICHPINLIIANPQIFYILGLFSETMRTFFSFFANSDSYKLNDLLESKITKLMNINSKRMKTKHHLMYLLLF
jgi:hypothetical protein